MQRMGMVIGLKPEMVTEYKRLHAAVWPEILDMISTCNITNYSIFLKGAREHAVWVLGVLRQRLRCGRGENGRRPNDTEMVGCLHALPGAP